MNNPKQNFFLTKNNQKIHYKFINNKSLITIIFLQGLMSDIKSKKAKFLKNFLIKIKLIYCYLNIVDMVNPRDNSQILVLRIG